MIAVLGQGYLLVREHALHGWSLRRLIGQTPPSRITVLHVQTDASMHFWRQASRRVLLDL
jgi:hypothetical protein